MPNLSSSNRSQLSYKLEGTYPSNYGVIQGGNGTKLLMLSETLDFGIKTLSSKAITSDRMVRDNALTGASAQGGFAFEQVFKEYDPFILGVLQANAWTGFNTTGVSGALPAITTISATSIVFTSTTAGAGDVSTLARGQWFNLKPPAGATQAVKDWCATHPLRVALSGGTLSATQIPIDASSPIDTAVVGVSMAAGAVIGSALAGNGTTMKSYSLQVGHEDINLYRQYRGMIPSKMDLSLKVGEMVTGMFEFMGKDMVQPIPTTGTAMGTLGASQAFTPANATKGVFDIIENGASITATTFIKSADLTIDNSLRAQEAVGVFGNAGIASGTLKLTGKVEVYLADATMYNKLLNGTASSLCIPIVDVDGNGYVFYYPRIKYTAGKVNASGQDQDNMLSMDFEAFPDTTGGSPTLGFGLVVYRVGAAI